MKKKTKVLLSSLLAIGMSASLATGATYALFTSTSQVNVAVTSGTVNVVATVNEDSLVTYSNGVEQQNDVFELGGSASYNAETATLILDKMCPLDSVAFSIDVTNNSNVAIQYRVAWNVSGELALALTATADGAPIVNDVSSWSTWTTTEAKTKTIALQVAFPDRADNNEYQNKTANITFSVEAVQGNATVLSGLGTQEKPYEISSASQLALISENIKNNVAPEEGGVDYASASYKLTDNIDLAGQEWTSIGAGLYPFHGTFDGNYKTISNVTLAQTYADESSLVNAGGDYGYAKGFFGVIGWSEGAHTNEKVTIKNLTLGVSYESEDAYVFGGLVGSDAAAHKGSARNSSLACDIEISNITVNGKIISTNNQSGATVGGIAGKLYTQGNIVIDGCTNNAEVNVETSSGKDNKVGGILGFYSGANSATITNNVNKGNVTSKSARSAGCKASGICITGATATSVNISGNVNTGTITGTEYAVAAIAFSGNDNPIYKITQHTTNNNSNRGQLYTLNYQTFELTAVDQTYLVYGGKSQTPADNTTDDIKYENGTPVLEINQNVAE